MSDHVYLLMKGGYYFRPDSRGYTGFKIEAGRYSEGEARQWLVLRPEISIVREDWAPEVSWGLLDDCKILIQSEVRGDPERRTLLYLDGLARQAGENLDGSPRRETVSDPGELVLADGPYLLMKRGLYWHLKGAGYTGIKKAAQRYTREEVGARAGDVVWIDDVSKAPRGDHDNVYAIREAGAPAYLQACFSDILAEHASATVERLEDALRRIIARSKDGTPGTSKVLDMARIAEEALRG